MGVARAPECLPRRVPRGSPKGSGGVRAAEGGNGGSGEAPGGSSGVQNDNMAAEGLAFSPVGGWGGLGGWGLLGGPAPHNQGERKTRNTDHHATTPFWGRRILPSPNTLPERPEADWDDR